MSDSRRERFSLRTLLTLFVLALVYRALHAFLFSDLIVAGSDMMQNQLLAAKFASGNFYGVLDTYWPPLYGIVVGAVTFVIDDLIVPALIVSIVANSLIAPLTYVLASQAYGRKASVIAGALAVFYPYLLNTTFQLGTESMYLAIILAFLILGWWALDRGSPALFFLSGLVLALAYLTRPEAIGYIFFLYLFIGVQYLRTKDRPTPKVVLVRVAALTFGFLLFASPYIGYLRYATGVWTVSNKATVNVAGGVLRSAEGDRNTSEMTTANVDGRVLFREVVDAERLAQTHIQSLAPLFLFILVALGLFGEKWSSDRLFRESYLLGFCILTTLGYVATVVLERYFYVLLPIFLVWMGRGIEEAERWISGSLSEWNLERVRPVVSKLFVPLCVAFAFFYMFSVNFYVRSTESTWQKAATEERDAGIWIRENGPESPAIFSGSFRPVFYAKGSQVWTETEDAAEILREVKAKHVDYVVDNDRSIRKYPYLKEFSTLLKNSEDFELVYENRDHPDFEISIYKPRSPNAANINPISK